MKRSPFSQYLCWKLNLKKKKMRTCDHTLEVNTPWRGGKPAANISVDSSGFWKVPSSYHPVVVPKFGMSFSDLRWPFSDAWKKGWPRTNLCVCVCVCACLRWWCGGWGEWKRRKCFRNVGKNSSLFYLLSNNHVNDMIMFDFRLEDEEVLSHFASFLKTLSLRLNPKTVQVSWWLFVCSILSLTVEWKEPCSYLAIFFLPVVFMCRLRRTWCWSSNPT